uniref:Uncharacterized protein n=1 Tax=Oryza sativa subsp. japonica TaxID=39947 RepID=Q6ZL49_ORYSJ|nr:hypothetical protein [Oryza sativa Japonica Group]
MGVHVFTDRLDFAAADWCFRLHGRPIMPPLSGVHDLTLGLPPSPPTGVFIAIEMDCFVPTSATSAVTKGIR